MPFIRSFTSKRYTCVVAVILLLGKIMPTYSYCVLKGLVYIAIIAFFSRQPFFYIKCTKSNMCSSCDVCLVSIAKCIFLARLAIL